MSSTLITISEISSILFSAACTPGLYELFTKRRLYQGTCQRNCTHCDAPGCGPIMACEVIQLFMCRYRISVLFWLVCICEGKYFASRRCLLIWACYDEGRCCVQSLHFQMPEISGCLYCDGSSLELIYFVTTQCSQSFLCSCFWIGVYHGCDFCCI